MMINTKHAKVVFGQIGSYQCDKNIEQNTREIRSGKRESEVVKVLQKGVKENTFSGYRKVNFADQTIKETYRKINKMLGGN